ncbi:MAG: extracellular solute-binding protein [Microcoleaceae cyanobacterium]
MKRRDILFGATALALGSAVTGCNRTVALRIEILKNSVPVQMLSQFRRSLPNHPPLDIVPKPQLQDLYDVLRKLQPRSQNSTPAPEPSPSSSQSVSDWLSNLRLWGSSNRSPSVNVPPADLVLIGDYWLAAAIRQGLVQSLNPALLSQWNQLPDPWQALVRRNAQGEPDPQGTVWGAPYRWGTTVIAYRADKFERLGWEPQDWSDLWREELHDRISLLDQPREVIGLTLKKLGHSYNTSDLSAVPELEAELRQLHRNVKLYDSTTYLKPLILGDTWLAVGWSTDLSLEVQLQNDFKVVIPRSGTSLWADLWVAPKSAPLFSAAKLSAQWIDFCWQPQVAAQLGGLTGATSPIALQMNPEDLPSALRDDPVLLPDPAILEKSEFLYPLSEAALEQYQTLWVKIRNETRV